MGAWVMASRASRPARSPVIMTSCLDRRVPRAARSSRGDRPPRRGGSGWAWSPTCHWTGISISCIVGAITPSGLGGGGPSRVVVRAIRAWSERLARRLGLSCLLAGLLLSGLPAPVAVLALPAADSSRGTCEETPVEDPESNQKESPGAKLGHFGVTHRRSHRLSRSHVQGRSMADRPTPTSSADHARLARPVRGPRGGGGHFFAEGRFFRQWVQSHLC